MVNLLTIVFNLDHGPYRDARWYQSGKEAVWTYVSLTDRERCPLWLQLREWILGDKGSMGHAYGEEREKELWLGLKEAWGRMTQKVAMARWFGWQDAASQFLPQWHSRLLTMLFLAMSLGIVSRKKHGMPSDCLHTLATEAAAQEPGSSSTSRDGSALARLRRSCTNSLDLVCAVLMDKTAWQLCRIIEYVIAPLRAWHGACNKDMIL